MPTATFSAQRLRFRDRLTVVPDESAAAFRAARRDAPSAALVSFRWNCISSSASLSTRPCGTRRRSATSRGEGYGDVKTTFLILVDITPPEWSWYDTVSFM